MAAVLDTPLLDKHGKPLHGAPLQHRQHQFLAQEEERLQGLYVQTKDRAIENPDWFFRNILNFPVLPWQLKAINIVLDVRRLIMGLPTMYNHEGKQRLTIKSCHGTGKTQFLALLMHIWNFTTYGKIACTAPKEAQLLRRLIPRYRFCMRYSPEIYTSLIEVLGKEIRVFNDPDWGSAMETATDPDSLAGYHEVSQLFLVDEASSKKLDPMYPVIEGALTTPGSILVEIGNPTRIEGEFHAHHCAKKIKDLYYRMHIKPSDAPELISEAWVETMRLKYGEDSPIYMIRVLGEFASFDEYLLIPLEWFDDSLDEERETDGSIPILKISVDIADGGADSTVVTAALHYDSFIQVLKQKAFYFDTGESPIKAAEAAINMFEAFDGRKEQDYFVVDGLGVGAGTVGYLLKKNYTVVNFKGGSKSSNPNKWRNRRVQGYISLYNAFKDNMIAIAPDSIDDEEELRAHVSLIKRNEDNDRTDDIQPKKKIKAEGNPSPDRADSLMMQMADRTITSTDDVDIAILTTQSSMANYDADIAI